jgi:hypothetical protein
MMCGKLLRIQLRFHSFCSFCSFCSSFLCLQSQGYNPRQYVGTYVATAASIGTVDALRCFQSQVKIGIDRQGRLYLRRAGVAGGPDCGAGPSQRGLSEWAFSDCSLVCVDATKHVFRRADRAFGQYADARAKDGEPAGVIGFGTDFDENVTHLFLQPGAETKTGRRLFRSKRSTKRLRPI